MAQRRFDVAYGLGYGFMVLVLTSREKLVRGKQYDGTHSQKYESTGLKIGIQQVQQVSKEEMDDEKEYVHP